VNKSFPVAVRKYLAVSRETLEDAACLVKDNRARSAVNRIYYATFYAASALILSENFATKKHSGVRALFNRHYIQTGLLDICHSKFYREIYDLRHGLDYLRGELITPEEVERLYDCAKFLIDAIEALLQAKYNNQ